jgi:hypothetical protein
VGPGKVTSLQKGFGSIETALSRHCRLVIVGSERMGLLRKISMACVLNQIYQKRPSVAFFHPLEHEISRFVNTGPG